jgi:hypothetical protein
MTGGRKSISSLPHQAAGTAFLRAKERAALFDEQGLGKTKQLIDAISAEIGTGSLQGALMWRLAVAFGARSTRVRPT